MFANLDSFSDQRVHRLLTRHPLLQTFDYDLDEEENDAEGNVTTEVESEERQHEAVLPAATQQTQDSNYPSGSRTARLMKKLSIVRFA